MEFFALAPRIREVFELLEYLPAVCLYAKNRRSQFVKVNDTMCASHGVADSLDMLGKTDRDFHPPALAQAYIAEDRRVMASGLPIPNQVWLVPFSHGTPQWYVSSKTPLFTKNDVVVGIAGVMYPIETPEDQRDFFQELLPGIRHIEQHFAERIRMSEMAERVGLSSTHFNRRFRELLKMSPSEYALSLRIQHAQRLLTKGTKSMAQIAMECGFADQSHFTNRFHKATGSTPTNYRTRFRC